MKKTVGRPRGRPRDPVKREAILIAARSLFLRSGLDVTTDEIAAEAKVAKATLYANFDDKDQLIEAVLRKESDRTISDEDFADSSAMHVDAALRAFGIRYLQFLNQRETLGWDRLIASAAGRSAELRQRLFLAGPGRAQILLRDIISRAMDLGQLNANDPEIAADELTGLWFGFVNLEIKLHARPPLTSSEIEERVDRGLQSFLRLYRS